MSDVAVVGVTAATGGRVQPGDRGGHFVVGLTDGVVEGESEFQGELGVRHALWGSGSHRCRRGRQRGVGWHHLHVIVSLVHQAARKPLAVPAVRRRRATAKNAGLLVPRHESAVPRRQVQGPVRSAPADRFWCAALSAPLPRRPLAHPLPGHPRHAPGPAPPVSPASTVEGWFWARGRENAQVAAFLPQRNPSDP
ncbi:hypothetical protein GCM10027162_63880 [Streptomyces incanus]